MEGLLLGEWLLLAADHGALLRCLPVRAYLLEFAWIWITQHDFGAERRDKDGETYRRELDVAEVRCDVEVMGEQGSHDAAAERQQWNLRLTGERKARNQ